MRAVVLAVLLLASQVHALNTPALHDRVNDTAGLLSEQQQGELEAKLKGIEDSTGHQFAFLSVPSLDGASIDGEEATDAPIEVLESPPII